MDIEYTKDNPLRCFFAFEGYNSQGLALNRLKQHFSDFDWVCVGRSEIDKYAIQAADALFPEAKGKNFGDISKIDWNEVPDFDLFTMSSPCQDFSQAGLQKGGAEGSGTRSSLLWECRRAILSKKPKYIVFENVKALVSQKFLPYFIKWQNELASYGYSNFAKVLNASSYGIPQNRERIFMVSILDENASYHFPEPFHLDKCLKDVLEEEVDEKYYLSKKLVDYVFSNGGKLGNIQGAIGVHDNDDDVANTITAQYWKTPRQGNYIKEPIEPRTDVLGDTGLKVIANMYENNAQSGRIYDPEGISPTIDTAMGGNREPKIIQKSRGFNKGGEHEISPTISSNSWECNNILIEPKILSYTRDANGKVVDRHFKDVANTIHGATGGGGNTDSFVVGQNYRIRKLTPRECFRLQDVDDEDIDKIFAAGISNTQCYKLAGNSITVAPLYHIFRKLFIEKENENKQLTLF